MKTTFSHLVVLQVETSDTIGNVKAKMQDKLGIPTKYQQLVFCGKKLEDVRTLSDYTIRKESIVRLVIPQGECCGHVLCWHYCL